MASLLSRERGPLVPVTDPIYHYTSSGGMIGALRARRLWASQATSMNDHAEILQGWKLITEVIDDLLSAHPGDGTLTWLRDWARDPLDKVRHVCILCASLRGDDANQWRLYGGASRGYAIELDPSAPLAAIADGGRPPAASPHPERIEIDFDVVFVAPWLRVVYDPREVQLAVTDLWRAMTTATPPPPDPTLSSAEQEQEHDVWRSELQAVAISDLATLAHLVKTDGFSGEHEVRTVVTHLLGADYMKYRPTDSGIVAYRELGRSPDGHDLSHPYFPERASNSSLQLPVRSVRLGPLAPDGHEETVEDFLATVDLEGIRVMRSTVPLR
ncbi:hypothetical protein [Nocardioides marmoribigeumensis]|uniref:DUF2971 domain-containing protein n=1 Tax=Nocardioides marmoribigeumensis TaxID=433649 RepID=A0ABU2BTM3_9ACTN|nr:hypothetical protein [Nocardioides marmoribigeumensis]MDR7361379.1 hypothetical protein [Nocardioides marmoribigeumensis]